MGCSNIYTMVCIELNGDTGRTLDPFRSDDKRVELQNFSTIRCPLNFIIEKGLQPQGNYCSALAFNAINSHVI